MLLSVLLVLFLTAPVCHGQSFVNILQNLTLPLTPKCDRQFQEFFANFAIDANSWALQMLDATSKIPSGLLSYNFGEMGDFDECINIRASTNSTGEILGKYCLGYISFDGSTNSSLGQGANSLGIEGTSSKVSIAPPWALCLPNGCTTDDANIVGNAILQSFLEGQGVAVSFSDFLCQTVKEAEPELTNGAIAAIVILVVLLSAVLGCTFYDIYCVFHRKNVPPLIVKGFSVYSNSQKIFKMSAPNSDQFPCMDGLKFISMMWVVAGHQYSIPMNGSITNLKSMVLWADDLYSMFLVSGTLSVDTFFTVGGALMAYGFMKAKQKNVPFNLFLYYLHRYLRLTAPFALVVLFSATLLKYMGSGPKWPFLTLYFQKNCEDNWWSALLYVQNYVNISKMCVGQTWYLNIDMQLYLISPIIFFLLWKYPKICISFLVLCGLAFMGVSFYEAWIHELPAIVSNLYTTHSTDFDNEYYLLTHTRSTPWIIGVILGYVLFKIKNNEMKLKTNKFVILGFWVVCLSTILACVLGGHSTLRSPEYDKIGNALHITLVRPVWSLAIAWIILGCTLNYGGPINWILSLPIYQVLNRFTYGIYLTHVTMLYAMAYNKKWPDYFSGFNMGYEFWGTLWYSTGLAAILVFMTESPVIVIEKILLGALRKKSVPKKADPEKGVDNAAFEN